MASFERNEKNELLSNGTFGTLTGHWYAHTRTKSQRTRSHPKPCTGLLYVDKIEIEIEMEFQYPFCKIYNRGGVASFQIEPQIDGNGHIFLDFAIE